MEVVVREEMAPAVAQTAQKSSFLNKSQADLERSIAHYPETAREATIWAQGFCREECKGNIQLFRSISEKLGFKYSQSYFYNILYGHYFKTKKSTDGKTRIDGNVGAWLEIVEALRKHDQTNTAAGKLGFIETPTYRCIYNFITERRARGAACKWGGITGPTGAQKSECAKYYKLLHNHGRTVYLEAPARKSLGAFQRKLATQYGAPIRSTTNAQEAEIRDNVNEEKCIIVDNAQRLYIPGRGNAQPIFDYLLELQDDTGCCVILFFTEDFVNGDLSGGRAKNYFEQFIGRLGGFDDILRLPKFTPIADLKVIARAYGLEPGTGAMEYLTKWSRLDGRVRLVFHRLNRAKQFAQLDGRNRINLDDMAEANSYIPSAIGEESEEVES
jgi:hypothetical protein